MKLEDYTKDNVKYFSFDGKVLRGKCVDVYDGDTVTIVLPVDNQYYKFRVRLADIDTPEIRTRDLEEKKQGYIAKDVVVNLILNKIVTVKCGDFDKYGRLLATILVDGMEESVNDHLVAGGYAEVYVK